MSHSDMLEPLGQQGFDPYQAKQDDQHSQRMRGPAIGRAISARVSGRGLRPNRPVFIGSAIDIERLFEAGVARPTRGMFRGIPSYDE